MKRKPPQDLKPLREWCEANGIKFAAAKGYRHKHGLSIEETIAYYQTDRTSMRDLCVKHGVSISAATGYKHRTKCTPMEAIEHCKQMALQGNRRHSAAKKSAETHGVDVKRVYYMMSKNRCSAEDAAKMIAESDAGSESTAQPTNSLLTRAWV